MCAISIGVRPECRLTFAFECGWCVYTVRAAVDLFLLWLGMLDVGM